MSSMNPEYFVPLREQEYQAEITQLRRDKAALAEACKALLEMPSSCTRDAEILENNTRRESARTTLKAAGIDLTERTP